MAQMRKNLDERAIRKAFYAIFKRFDYNHNGKNNETSKNMKIFYIGKLFIKDFVGELEIQKILLDEEEIEKISAYADAEILYFCTHKNMFCKNKFVDGTNNSFMFSINL
jgi:hypothetical protein